MTPAGGAKRQKKQHNTWHHVAVIAATQPRAIDQRLEGVAFKAHTRGDRLEADSSCAFVAAVAYLTLAAHGSGVTSLNGCTTHDGHLIPSKSPERILPLAGG